MILTLKLDPTNWLEVTWFEQTIEPDTIIPAKEAVLDEEGNEISPAEPERVEPGQVTKTQVRLTVIYELEYFFLVLFTYPRDQVNSSTINLILKWLIH